MHKLKIRLLPFLFVLYVLPFLFLLYVVAFLDRINIGFAALTMNKELAITSQQFGLIAGIFFIGYVIFEVPSNLLLHRIGARIWIARILLSWGIVAMLTGFVQSVAQFYVVRFLLGVAEAGFFPGIVLYLTYWFRQREQAHAIALFMTALPVASILGAPVSGVILDHAHWLGVSSWRWLLILEGLPAIGCAVLTYFLLPDRPEDATFLTQNEKEWITAELRREELQKLQGHQMSATQALTNRRVWQLGLTALAWDIGLYWMSFWMPQVLKSLSSLYSNTLVGFLVVIPQLVGLVGMVLVARSSDRSLERRFHTAIPAIVGGTALLLLTMTRSSVESIALLSLMAAGIYSFIAPFFTIPSEFLSGYSAASGIALINSVANIGAFVGPYAIGAITGKTRSLSGGMAFAGVSLLASATLALLLPRKARANVTGAPTSTTGQQRRKEAGLGSRLVA
ncbi:MAG: MFS transporter [Acidobacteria bacterium]|nr:MAG: MFS transporter [Acidobacteriota bacterium]